MPASIFALGCDNYSCAETQNIFIAMRMLCLLPAVTDPEPRPINAAYALRAATLTGRGRSALAAKVGALKPGMAADLMILDLNEPAFVPFNSAARQIVFAEAAARSRPCWSPAGRWSATASSSPSTRPRSPRKRRKSRRRSAETPQALASRNSDLIAPLLNANREAWKVPLGFERYIGRGNGR